MVDSKSVAAALVGAGFLAVVTVFALTAAPGAGGAQTAAEATPSEVVVAKVNGEAVYLSELLEAYSQLPPQAQQMGVETIYPFLLERVIDQKLLGLAAAKSIAPDDPEVEEQMAMLRERVTMQVYFTRELEQKVTEESIREGYQQFLEDNPPTEELHARHILVETEEKAKEVLSEIQGGKDFAEAAKEHSTGPSGPNGGDLGYFGADAMVKPFADAAFAMQAGEISSEPVQTEFGWHLIKVEDRRETPQPAYEEMRDQISQQLSQEAANEILEGLRGDATIEKFDMQGNPEPAPQEPAPGADPAQQ